MRKFLHDVESQYDDKLGFETKINKIELKKEKLEYKGYLLSQHAATTTLQYLYLHGVTNNDIIEMNSIISSFIDGSINFEVNKQSSYRDKLKVEIDHVNSQFQKINELTIMSLRLVNSLSI